MNLENVHSAFFVGIGGIGMSAIARYFNQRGIKVYGYDKTETTLTRALTSEGISVHYTDDTQLIPEKVDLVIYTPAIPSDHKQLSHFKAEGYKVLKRSEALGLITENKYTIAVAGAHGKTTVTSMIAHILTHSGMGCTAFLGGIAVNYNSNYISSVDESIMVVEADEYDRSFLRLKPNVAVITAVDTDHLEIYGSKAGIEQAFVEFTQNIPEGGTVIAHEDVSILDALQGPQVLTYGERADADVYLSNVSISNASYVFDVVEDGAASSYKLNMGGRHNVLNATAASAACKQKGVSVEAIGRALESFRGIKRRFEYVYKDEKTIYIDDYAHHPKEIQALLSSVKELYPGKVITAVFQPHLYSRTRDLATEFAQALDIADQVLLMPIYPARELPILGVTSQLILDGMKNGRLVDEDKVVETLQQLEPELILTVGAGDIDKQVPLIEHWLLERAKTPEL